MSQDGRLLSACVALALSSVLTLACGAPPGSPGAPTALTPVAPAPVTYLRGLLMDMLGRPVAAARVEIVSGPLAGTFTASDDQGRFDFTSTSREWSTVTLLVSKGGFESTTSTATWRQEQSAGRPSVTRLPTSGPVALHAGEYRLTIGMDLATAHGRPASRSFPEIACVGFPPDLASRTYDATISEYQGVRQVSVKGPGVVPQALEFSILVAGDEAAVTMEWPVTEEFGGNRYFDVSGGADATRFTLDANAVHIPVGLAFQYCELTSARGIQDCSQVPLDRIVRRSLCASDRATMTFARR